MILRGCEPLKYVIGIDGGGTKTILRASGLDGITLTEVAGGPSNMHTASIIEVSKELYGMLDSALNLKALKKEDCGCLCMGAAGVDREYERKLLEGLFYNYGLTCPIYIANDAEVMLAAGVGKPEGVVVISGTGSIAYGKDKKGNACRSGGWGHLIGDEGSGYWIAKEAINAAVKAFDKRGEETMLLEMLMTKLGLKEPWDFIGYIYNNQTDKKDIASLAVATAEACKAGDKVAQGILENASWELFTACDAVIKKLNFANEDYSIVAGGSVLQCNEFVYDTFCSYVKGKYPRADIIKPAQNAAAGAAAIALHMLDKGKL